VVAARVERVRLMVTLDTVAMVVQAGLGASAALNAPALLIIVLATLPYVTTASYAGPSALAANASPVSFRVTVVPAISFRVLPI